MITIINNLPNNVLGFKFSGEITANDYTTVIYPALKSYTKEKNKIKILCQFDKTFEKFNLGAILDDTKMGLKYFFEWEKVAFVSDIDWINNMLKTFSFLMPGHLNTYHNADLEKAIKWLE